jgi:aromatic ring-opening dioxygenase LigB subunit
MMTLVYACIAPHGSEAIPQLASKTNRKKFEKTRDGLLKLGAEVGRAKPDTIVVATPHNLRLWKNIGVILTENSMGTLQASTRNRRSVRLKTRCDVEFAKELLARSRRAKLPVIGANYGTTEGVTSDMPMDWGTLVPLWFMIQRCRRKPRLVIVTPSREIPLSKNYQFGRVIAEQAEAYRKKRIIFVASADQAHAHKRTGPYGYSRMAKEYDIAVLNALRRNRIGEVMGIKRDLVKAAKPDSLWQMAILAGIAEKVKLKPQLLSYDVPTYFGMICANFIRTP